MKKAVALLITLGIIISVAVSTVYAKTYDYVYTSGDVYPESEHNYQNDYFCSWEYTYSQETDGLFVTFSDETLLNEDYNTVQSEYGEYLSYDYIYISYPFEDSWNYISDSFQGDELSGKTFYIPSKSFRITLNTDAEGNDFGFSIDRISDVPPDNETMIRYHFSGSDYVDNYSFHGDGNAVVADFDETINCGYAFAGWSTQPDGKTEYVAYDILEAGKVHDLYAVWIKPIIEPQDTFSFLNSDVGNVYPAEDNYYMTDGHYNTMISNLFRNFGLGPIPGPIVAAVLSTYPSWEHKGSCYGIATSEFLQYHGAIDFLEGTEAETMSEIELNGEIISRINYYQALSASSYLCENLAPQTGTPIYSEQLKNMFESVESGNPVLFSYYNYGNPYLLSTGHTVVMTAAFTDANGNHYLVACDSNYSYSRGECHYYRISPDFSKVYDCRKNPDSGTETRIGGFNWTADYEQFTSFDINGNGNPAVWYTVFFNHILYWIKTVFAALFSI